MFNYVLTVSSIYTHDLIADYHALKLTKNKDTSLYVALDRSVFTIYWTIYRQFNLLDDNVAIMDCAKTYVSFMRITMTFHKT